MNGLLTAAFLLLSVLAVTGLGMGIGYLLLGLGLR
jgi:hypothetical protein